MRKPEPSPFPRLPGERGYQHPVGYPKRIGPHLLLHAPDMIEEGQPQSDWPAWDMGKYPARPEEADVSRMPGDLLRDRQLKAW